jgi:hypothetical protein
MKPVVAAVAGALIAGVTMYTVGADAAQREALSESPVFVQPLAQHFTTPTAAPAATFVSNAPASARAARTQSRPVYRTADRPVQRSPREDRPYEDVEERTKTKTALIIGGSAASGAGVGAIVGGKKGALIGAAIGGGAASISEATQRR